MAFFLLVAFARIAPPIVLALWMLVVHAPGKVFFGRPWHDWEWGVVALAMVLKLLQFARKRKAASEASRKKGAPG